MDNYRLYDDLRAIPTPLGYATKWRSLTFFADPHIRAALRENLSNEESPRNNLIISAVCSPPPGAAPSGSFLTPEAEQYICYVLGTADTAMMIINFIYGASAPSKTSNPSVISLLQESFKLMPYSPYPYGTPLAGDLLTRAKVVCLTYALRGTINDREYLISHFNETEPYLEHIIRRGDMSREHIDLLLTTKPSMPLTGGIL